MINIVCAKNEKELSTPKSEEFLNKSEPNTAYKTNPTEKKYANQSSNFSQEMDSGKPFTFYLLI